MAEDSDRPIIEYATPDPSPRKPFDIDFGRVAIIALVAIAIFLPPPGDLRFGHNPQWHLVLDEHGLSIGHFGRQDLLIKPGMLLLLKLLLISVPIWLIQRARLRRQRK